MKSFRTWWSVLPATALVLGACNEKKKEESTGTPATPGNVVEKVKAAVSAPAAPEVKALTPGERAAMLGIVGHLPKDVDSVLGIYDGQEIVKRAKALKSWEFLREVAKEEDGADPEEEMAAELGEAGKFLGQEMFFAAGKGSSPQLENLIAIQHRYQYYTFRLMVQSFAKRAEAGDLDPSGGFDPELLMALGKEIVAKEIGLVNKIAVPPMLAGIKAADQETLKAALEKLAPGIDGMAEQLGEAGAKAVEFTKGGVKFKGVKLFGSFLADQLQAGRERFEEMVPPADVDRIIASLKEKNLVISYGSLDNYLMLYVGGSEDACPLVDKVEDSLAASDAISYVDGFKDKKLVGFYHADKSFSQAAITTSVKDMALGVRDGLAGSSAFGDTKDLAALLEMVGDKESELLGLTKVETGGAVALLDNGFKIEAFGGANQNAMDLSAPHKLGKLGGGESTVLFANWVANPEYTKRANAMGEALIETGYAMAEKVGGLEIEDPSLMQFKQGLGLFNEKFRTDVVGLWSALQSTQSGLGHETALVVDLKGAVPTVSTKIPQAFVDKGKAPRIAVVTPVTDRKKLADSWTAFDGSLIKILKTASEVAEQDLPVLKPTNTEKDGLTTWFYGQASLGDDLMPSISLNDKWFVASTSKLQAQELAKAADSPADDRTGAWFELDFDALRGFTANWVNLLETDGADLMGPSYEKFKTELPRIKKGLAAFEEFDSLSISERMEGGKHRATLHFKVR